MENHDLFVEAIHHVHAAVAESDIEFWWPKRLNTETGMFQTMSTFTYDLGQGRTGCGGHPGNNEHSHAHMAAYLRLNEFKEPCTLFAFPIEDAIDETGNWKASAQGEDIVVGYISSVDDTFTITPAWKRTSVYPMIGNQFSDVVFDVPRSAKWLLCAALDTPYRRAVALYGQAVGVDTLANHTLTLNTITRMKHNSSITKRSKVDPQVTFWKCLVLKDK